MRSYAQTFCIPNGSSAEPSRSGNISKRRRINNSIPIEMPSPNEGQFPMKADDVARPAMVVLASTTRSERWNPETSVFLTGAVKDGKARPPVGLVDIGISKAGYLFQMALPGVNKDPCQFNCRIEGSGKVEIQGVTTTGESVILRESRVFQMVTKRLCPPGPFTVSFHLPGPVDTRTLTTHFGSDGIFEAVVMKHRGPK